MLKGTLAAPSSLSGKLDGRAGLGGLLMTGGRFYPDYGGPYEADALFSEQVFATSEKIMRDNFTVHAINYTEAPNPYGITVTIGG